MNHQLALTIQPNEEATFSNFFWTEDNALLKNQLMHAIAGVASDSPRYAERLIYLWGHAGSGKSHILQACVHHLNVLQPAIYLPLGTLKEWGPSVIDGLEEQTLLCVDELDAIAAEGHWEEALFHLYNRVRDQGKTTLILAGRNPPRHAPIQLADLRSRLGGSLVWQLHELNDEAKVSSLCLQAEKRGLELSTHVGQFLVTRCARNMHDLHALLNRLDEASWVAQRRLTIPFIKTTLGI